MPLSHDLKQRILENPFCDSLRLGDRVDRVAYARLFSDLRRLIGETRDDLELDKDVLQDTWTAIRVAEGTAGRMRRGGRSEDQIFEVENMTIERDGLFCELLSVNRSAEDWGWHLNGHEPTGDVPLPPTPGSPTSDS